MSLSVPALNIDNKDLLGSEVNRPGRGGGGGSWSGSGHRETYDILFLVPTI